MANHPSDSRSLLEMPLTPLQIATRRHAAADTLISGTYGRMNGHFQGCSIGCLAHDLEPEWDNDDIDNMGHAAVAEHYGYPEWLARLQDTVFEGLPNEDRADWHVSVADAIAERGRDWQIVVHAIHAAILRVALRTAGSAAGVVQAVIDLHEAAVRGEPQESAAWSAAWSAARRVAASAVDSAAWSAASAAEREVWSVTWSAAASVTWSAARSTARSTARSATYREIADAILEEIQRQQTTANVANV